MKQSSKPHIGHLHHDQGNAAVKPSVKQGTSTPSVTKGHDTKPHQKKSGSKRTSQPGHTNEQRGHDSQPHNPPKPTGPSLAKADSTARGPKPHHPGRGPVSGPVIQPEPPQRVVVDYRRRISSYETSIYLQRGYLREEQARYQRLKSDVLKARESLYELKIQEARLLDADVSIIEQPNKRVYVKYPAESLMTDLIGFVVSNIAANHHDRYLTSLELKLNSMQSTVGEARAGNAVLQRELTDLESRISAKGRSINELKVEAKRVETFNRHLALIVSPNLDDSVLLALNELPSLFAPCPRFRTSKAQGLPHLETKVNLLSRAIDSNRPDIFAKALSKGYPHNIPSLDAHNPFLMIVQRLPGSLEFLDGIRRLDSEEVNLILNSITLSDWPLDDGIRFANRLLIKERELLDRAAQTTLISFMSQHHSDPKIMTVVNHFFSNCWRLYDLDNAVRQSFLKHSVKAKPNANPAREIIKLYQRPTLNLAVLLKDLKSVFDSVEAASLFNQCLKDPAIGNISAFSEVSAELIETAFSLAEDTGNDHLLQALLAHHLEELKPSLLLNLQFNHNRVRLVLNLQQDLYTYDQCKAMFNAKAEITIKEVPTQASDFLSSRGLNGFKMTDKVLLAYFTANVDALLRKGGSSAVDPIVAFANSLAREPQGLSTKAVQVLTKHIKNEVLSVLNCSSQNGVIEKFYDKDACSKLMGTHRMKKKVCGIPVPATLFFTPSTVAYQKIDWGFDATSSIDSQKEREAQEFSSLGLK